MSHSARLIAAASFIMLTLTAIMSVLPAGCTAFKTFEILYKQSNQNVRPPINQPADNKIVDAYRELTHMTILAEALPTGQPTVQPSTQPTRQPVSSPTHAPTVSPSGPSSRPTSQPSRQPTRQPTAQPSTQPTKQPVGSPSHIPTANPTEPSSQPTSQPSRQPTLQPTRQPTRQPTSQPSMRPSSQPTVNPTQPSGQPTSQPTRQPTIRPTSRPTTQPSQQPSTQPTKQPISNPTTKPSSQPTAQPTNPTGQPTSHPTNPTGQPTSQPSALPTSIPTSAPTGKVKVLYNWVFDPSYGLALSVDVALSINGACIAYCLWAMYAMGVKASSDRRVIAGLIAAAMVVFLNFVFLCARFHYFLTSENEYALHKTLDGTFVWPGKMYEYANLPTLKDAQCPYSLTEEGEIADLDSAEHVCEFMVLSFSGDLLGDGMAKFSIGVGLIFQAVLMALAFFMKTVIQLTVKEATKEEKPDCCTSCIASSSLFVPVHSLQWIIVVLIQSQQFCVLMLLTNVIANDYCAQLIVPTSIRKAICLYQIGVHALPWAIIFTICGAIAGFMAQASNHHDTTRERERTNAEAVLGVLLLIATAFCAIHAIALWAYWLFAGFVIGIWFEFAALSITFRFIAVELLGISVIFANDMLEHIVLYLAACNIRCDVGCLQILLFGAARAITWNKSSYEARIAADANDTAINLAGETAMEMVADIEDEEKGAAEALEIGTISHFQSQ
jgi:Na+-transporting methylmalonyl-CoA/oxaloacetate decarboxylase gamma subunit